MPTQAQVIAALEYYRGYGSETWKMAGQAVRYYIEHPEIFAADLRLWEWKKDLSERPKPIPIGAYAPGKYTADLARYQPGPSPWVHMPCPRGCTLSDGMTPARVRYRRGATPPSHCPLCTAG